MDSNNSNFGSNTSESEANMPLNEANQSGSSSKSKAKEYGKKSLAPIIDVLHKHKSDIIPYADAISKGLNGAVSALREGQASDADKTVSGWFQEAANWFEGARTKLSNGSSRDLLNYLETQAQKSPGLMFSSSYIAGLAFGRVGKHFMKAKSASSSTTSTTTGADSSFSSTEGDQFH